MGSDFQSNLKKTQATTEYRRNCCRNLAGQAASLEPKGCSILRVKSLQEDSSPAPVLMQSLDPKWQWFFCLSRCCLTSWVQLILLQISAPEVSSNSVMTHVVHRCTCLPVSNKASEFYSPYDDQFHPDSNKSGQWTKGFQDIRVMCTRFRYTCSKFSIWQCSW